MPEPTTRKETQFLVKQPFPTAKPAYVEEKLKPFAFPHFAEDKVSRGSDNVNSVSKRKPLYTNYVLTLNIFEDKSLSGQLMEK